MHCVQSLLQVNGSPLPLLDPEVLQVHAPPFVSKESLSEPAQRNFSQTQQQCFFIKKNNDRPDIKAGNPKEETTENVSVPKDLDLVALPQLCFPGETRLNAKLDWLLNHVSASDATLFHADLHTLHRVILENQFQISVGLQQYKEYKNKSINWLKSNSYYKCEIVHSSCNISLEWLD